MTSEPSVRDRAIRLLGPNAKTLSQDELLETLVRSLEAASEEIMTIDALTAERDALRHRCFSGRGSMTVRVSSPVRNGYGCAPITPRLRSDEV